MFVVATMVHQEELVLPVMHAVNMKEMSVMNVTLRIFNWLVMESPLVVHVPQDMKVIRVKYQQETGLDTQAMTLTVPLAQLSLTAALHLDYTILSMKDQRTPGLNAGTLFAQN